jgi:hypothetical protein
MRTAQPHDSAACAGRRETRRSRAGGIALALILTWVCAGPALAQFSGSFAIDKVRLNRENWLDWRAYQPPADWRWDAYRAPNAMQASVGSLSMVRFYETHQLRLEKDLGAYATFLYSQSEASFFRSDPLYQEVEMRFGAESLFGSIIGFPRADKAQGNFGLAAAWGKRTDPNTVRLSVLEEQPLFNDKTDTSARLRRPLVLNRLQARVAPREQLVMEVDYRDEPTAVLDSPDLAERQTFRSQKLDAWADWWVTDAWMLGAVISDNTERRQLIPAAGAASPAQEQALTWGWTELHALAVLPGGDRLTLAVVDSQLDNQIRSGDPNTAWRFRLRTTQAYALWEIPHSAWLHWTVSLQAGEVRLFKPSSPDAAERNDSPTVEGKLGLGILLTEVRSYRFWFLSTWAPDAISGQKWDGGNMQFQLFF